jgi:hypothetical protein
VLHHRGSQQGVQTDSWEICASVQLDLDERKNIHYLEYKKVDTEKENTGLDNNTNFPRCDTLIIYFHFSNFKIG